ncbi:Serine/threonine-protein kinase 36 [Tetrabaena socialis]|uniref:Serine/threonine-protein kinase 36 n=1 Tax=Tetrabaena socialis TaxID=47790 RepID=A0A2J8AHX7_9CHLO|nr:Serine/threonine-protein kinase 36 [Tetrabaena socialis]|eukprot:PNH12120.1 Serine/threonine-protein kinase 36 [Tetrabaena socialis]
MPSLAQPTSAACATFGRSLSDSDSSRSLGGKYHFCKRVELYRGSVSTVYKCQLLGRAGSAEGAGSVVVKTYHKAKMAEKHLHKLEREIAAMRALSRGSGGGGGGAGVVQLLDTFEDANAVYLVMECCEGGDLFKRLMLHGGKLPEQWVCAAVISPLLQVLESMHRATTMHRDIKPENIFLTAAGAAKLGDFGLAIDWSRELPFSRSGTLDYMAPEVLVNPATHTQESAAVTLPLLQSKNIRPYTSAVDLWAVGCLAYELVVGRPPFEVEDEKQTASLIIYSHHIRCDPALGSPAWADFVRQALTKDPALRPSAAALLSHPWVRAAGAGRPAAGAPRAVAAAGAACKVSAGPAASSVAPSARSSVAASGGPGVTAGGTAAASSAAKPLAAAPAPAAAAALHNLAPRDWSAVAAVSLSPSHVPSPSSSSSGSAFDSPQRPTAAAAPLAPAAAGSGSGGGAKGLTLDSYGLPPPTPGAAKMPVGEWCSPPRPAGVLQRVKYHLRSGAPAAEAVAYATPAASAVPAPQQQQWGQWEVAGLIVRGVSCGGSLAPTVELDLDRDEAGL